VLAVFGGACAILLAPTLPEIAAVCERHGADAFGAGYAAFNLAYAVGMAAGPIAGGILAPALGFTATLLLLGAGTAAYLPAVWGRPGQTKHTETPATPALRKAG
jgi:hypothetical protein